MKKQVYREGDKVRILRSRFIDRIGYSFHPSQFLDDARAKLELRETQTALGFVHSLSSQRVLDKLAHALAFAMVVDRGFGGGNRAIHYKKIVPVGELHLDEVAYNRDGEIATVLGKYTAYTGTRYPSYSGQSYEGEWDYEPGGLSNRKTHVILRTNFGDIETCDVEPA